MSTHGTALRDGIATAISALAEPVGTLAPARLSASEYIAALREVEDLGRLVDAARIALAGEAEKRTQGPIDTLGALGYASAVDAVAMITSAADRDAKRRIRVGESLNSGVSLTGAETGCTHPAIAASVFAGNLSIDVATILIDALDGVGSRVDDAVLLQAEEALVEVAAGTPEHPPLRADLVRGQAQLFVEVLDPEGVLPREEVARRKRRFTIGRETQDGLIPVNGLLTLEVGASLKRLIDAHVRKVSFSDDPDSMVEHVDDRFPHQKRHDTFADILSAAARVKDAPELAGSAPAITVAVTQAALDSGEGVGAIDGLDIPLSVEAIGRLIDSRGMQQVTFNGSGRVLSLGSVQRCFTPSQRRAINARDGGCVIPGCTTPAGWCEVHHVIPWRDGGPTHTDNGVLLCWGHHQIIDSGPWELSMPDGVPYVRGPGHWTWTHTTKSRTRPPSASADGNP
ncbi:HNH endonuclease signature motif containing protein [Labedella endophytica]|nr:HNH endonuclease signature motif containing protein [Labedella endophytica]